MCGRYALALRPSQVRAYLENDNMPVYEAPEDEGDAAPRQSYNFCPGYHGIVYRADTPDHGAGPRDGDIQTGGESDGCEQDEHPETRYKLQSMTWGLVPFWTKRNPDYGTKMKTINCRADSLIDNTGMWTSMKQKKRCVVVVQGFFEWLKKGKEKIPHYVKRRDGKLMCFAGLWDCVQYEGHEEKLFTYTVITTDSNKQLKFLHDRMPVILDNGSEDLRVWLDPNQFTWSKTLQHLLKPFDGELDVYPVKKEVGKVGNNSPDFIVPVTELKSSIGNFFAKGGSTGFSTAVETHKDSEPATERVVSRENSSPVKGADDRDCVTIDHESTENNAPLPVPIELEARTKRELDIDTDDDLPKKVMKTSATTAQGSIPLQPGRKTRSSTSNNTRLPSKQVPGKAAGSQKITSFFKADVND